jgi:hypothetical protein
MTYLSRDLSNWSPGKIPATKMKVDIMRDQLPNPIRFIINHISLWPAEKIDRPYRTNLYQEYLGSISHVSRAKSDLVFIFACINKKFFLLA